ncbi:MAG: ABC transporter ATP-binding protein [Pirellulales bacterium]|nr:ABC transporter ATP-binding protein [Pirellulales bacterium]
MSDEKKKRVPHEGVPLHPGDPRVHFGPRVRGGPPLSGGPKLEVDGLLAGVAPENLPPAEETKASPPRPAPPAKPPAAPARQPFHLVDPVHTIGGPHLRREEVSLGSSTCAAKPGTIAVAPLPTPGGRRDGAHETANVFEVSGLVKNYRKGPVVIPVLQGVNLTVRRGEFLAVVGQSGSGKSTLLHLMGTLDAPNEGTIHFEGQRIDNLPSGRRDALRNERFGMIFQFYHLLPELNMLENVLVPLMIGQSSMGYLWRRRKLRTRAAELLELVGLSHRLKHKPRELSGGEMQRTAIARALINRPDLLLADEPTGNLDHETGQDILGLLRRLNREGHLTIVMVTHDQSIAAAADRTVRLVDGQLARAA